MDVTKKTEENSRIRPSNLLKSLDMIFVPTSFVRDKLLKADLDFSYGGVKVADWVVITLAEILRVGGYYAIASKLFPDYLPQIPGI